MSRCDVVITVSDADLGEWDEAWGVPEVHEFPCEAEAVVTVTTICEHGATDFNLCRFHAPEETA